MRSAALVLRAFLGLFLVVGWVAPVAAVASGYEYDGRVYLYDTPTTSADVESGTVVDSPDGSSSNSGSHTAYAPVARDLRQLPDSVAPTSALDDLARLCRSFSADTEVLMADGKTKPIAEIALGDEVWSIDPETGEAGAREVIAVWPHEDQLLEFMVEGGSVTTTEDHHFWNQTDHGWQETRDIDPGDHLLTADGQVVQAGELDWQTAHYATAYDLSVAGTHSYFVAVGGDEVLVHNQGCEDYAREAQEIIGGDIYRIEAPGRLRLGSDHPLDVDGAWRHHEFVVKDGLVYDQHYNGIAYDLYMEQFPYLDALTLSKVD